MESMKLSSEDKHELFERLEKILHEIQSSSSTNGKMILTSKDLQSELDVSRNQLYNWRKCGLINFYGKGKKIWYFREDVIKFVKTYGNEIAKTAKAE